MCGFRTLKAEYVSHTSIEQGGANRNSLDIVYSLEARYQDKEENFLFMVERKEVKLDTGKDKPDIPANPMMRKLGNALYPVVMVVSKDAKVLGVKNSGEIYTRWNNIANGILEEAYSVPADKYIKMARPNIADRKSFMKAFSRQIFIQLFFRNYEDEFFFLNTVNLTGIYSGDTVRCDRTSGENNIVYFETIGDWGNECRFEYVFSELGDILSVNGFIQKKTG